jgi:hypothetical protein
LKSSARSSWPAPGCARRLHAVLEAVGDLGDRVVVERRRHALDRVRHPEDEVERLGPRRVALELEQPPAHLLEVLAGLRQEDGAVLGHVQG